MRGYERCRQHPQLIHEIKIRLRAAYMNDIEGGRTSDGSGGLNLIIRESTVITVERHDDNFLEDRNRCQK